MKCRFCGTELIHELVDLINAPPSNSYLSPRQLLEPEFFYPLKLYVCHECFLVQIDEYKSSKDIFSENYLYFSSYSTTWLDHAQNYVNMVTDRFELNPTSLVVEIASNDGYLLQYFLQKQIPCLGIEPTATARIAEEKGIEVINDFFGEALATRLVSSGRQADLIIGNNVLAHVPDLNDFVKSVRQILKPHGVITMEFPHVMRMIERNQFDTIYHEHFSYFSLHAVDRIFSFHKLTIFDVEELSTHGGSLRIYAKHDGDATNQPSMRVAELLEREAAQGVMDLSYYDGFQEQVDQVKTAFVSFMVDQKKDQKTVVGYGAAAKGNTLLNYCGIKKDLLAYVVDKSPHKQGAYLPGSHIPIVSEEEIVRTKPDYVLILPWNLKEEITHQLRYIREWGGQFVTAIPNLEIQC